MKSGGMLAVGTTTVAHSQQDNGLSVQSLDKGYGTVVPGLGGTQAEGLLLDLSFSGDAIQGGNLFSAPWGDSGAVRGTLSGPVSGVGVIPERATLLLLDSGPCWPAEDEEASRQEDHTVTGCAAWMREISLSYLHILVSR